MAIASSPGVYRGPERRRNRTFVTVNSEYHCRGRLCVAVENRHTHEFMRDHPAIGRMLMGGLRFDLERILVTPTTETPHEGEQLCFASGRKDDLHDVVTSTLVRIERPPREVAARYPAHPAIRG